ncbi:MAG: hypothetical protein KJZ84_13665 [Bryobacteraceae bacterium]|nr:hypothetical protein [Bryobacteraceae bacterium]
MPWHTTIAAFVSLAIMAPAADEALLRLLPSDALLAAGIDVRRAGKSAFGQRILQELKEEDDQFGKLIQSSGFDPQRDLREVLLGSVGRGEENATLLIARGRFDAPRIAGFLESHGGEKSTHSGVEIWRGRDEAALYSFAFLDSSVALFGAETLVRQAVERRAGRGSMLGEALAVRVARWSRKSDAWFVSLAPLESMGRGGGGLIPAGLVLDAIREANVAMRFGATIDLEGELAMRSAFDARALTGVINLMLPLLRMSAGREETGDMAQLADSVKLTAEGERVQFAAKFTEAQLQKLSPGRKD